MDTSFWNGRKVFITGHTGFKGSWLSLWLQHLSARVIGYSLPPPSDPNLFESANVGAGMVSIEGDVRDTTHLRASIREHEPEIVIHMAAQSIVRASYEDPIETYSTNVMGTVNVLDAIRELPRRVIFVNVTTDKCYENKEWVWGYRESDRLGGHDPYSNSKACAELVTQSYRDSFFGTNAGGDQGKLVATARAGNVIGGGDWTRDQLIPDIIKAIREQRPVLLRNPQAVRPWQFVLDCLCGYMTLAQQLCLKGAEYACAWNFGPRLEDTLSVQDIVERLIALSPRGGSWIRDVTTQPHEAGYLRLDTSLSALKLRWSPRLGLTESLEWIWNWYEEYFRQQDPKAICLDQIGKFEKRLNGS